MNQQTEQEYITDVERYSRGFWYLMNSLESLESCPDEEYSRAAHSYRQEARAIVFPSGHVPDLPVSVPYSIPAEQQARMIELGTAFKELCHAHGFAPKETDGSYKSGQRLAHEIVESIQHNMPTSSVEILKSSDPEHPMWYTLREHDQRMGTLSASIGNGLKALRERIERLEAQHNLLCPVKP